MASTVLAAGGGMASMNAEAQQYMTPQQMAQADAQSARCDVNRLTTLENLERGSVNYSQQQRQANVNVAEASYFLCKASVPGAAYPETVADARAQLGLANCSLAHANEVNAIYKTAGLTRPMFEARSNLADANYGQCSSQFTQVNHYQYNNPPVYSPPIVYSQPQQMTPAEAVVGGLAVIGGIYLIKKALDRNHHDHRPPPPPPRHGGRGR